MKKNCKITNSIKQKFNCNLSVNQIKKIKKYKIFKMNLMNKYQIKKILQNEKTQNYKILNKNRKIDKYKILN